MTQFCTDTSQQIDENLLHSFKTLALDGHIKIKEKNKTEHFSSSISLNISELDESFITDNKLEDFTYDANSINIHKLESTLTEDNNKPEHFSSTDSLNISNLEEYIKTDDVNKPENICNKNSPNIVKSSDMTNSWFSNNKLRFSINYKIHDTATTKKSTCFDPNLDFVYKILHCEYDKLKKINGKYLRSCIMKIKCRHVSLIYESVKDYKNTYCNLLYLETIESIAQLCAKDHKWNECRMTGPIIRRKNSIKTYVPMGFKINTLEYKLKLENFENEETPVVNSLICLKYKGKYSFAYVYDVESTPKLDFNKKYKVKPFVVISTLKIAILLIRSPLPKFNIAKLELRFISKLNSVYKMNKSLNSIENSVFVKNILQSKISCENRIPAVNKTIVLNMHLNKEQSEIVLTISEDILRNPKKSMVRMIHGPPGTGKTHTITALIYQIILPKKDYLPIMVCAPSNAAADEIALRIAKYKKETGIKLIRIGIKNKMREEVKPYCLDESLHFEEKLEEIKRSDIIISTLTSSYCELTKNINFSCCIIDESCQCHEPESLIPFLLNFSKLILIGDPNQLSATVLSNRAQNYGFRTSMFERFYKCGIDSKTYCGIYKLKVQYRMHQDIVSWPSKEFYHNSLITPREITQIRSNFIKPYLVFDIKYSKENKIDKSTCNQMEANFILCLCQVLSNRTRGMKIGIITPYNEQRMLLQKLLSNMSNISITVSTVDMFQGQEEDIIICSFVRSNNCKEIGFLKDVCRLNVALTRAKSNCFIVGSLDTLISNKTFKSLIDDAKRRKLVHNFFPKYSKKLTKDILSNILLV